MKFYEKIIVIDKVSLNLMTITFNEGFFKFDKGLKIAGNTTITGTLDVTGSGDHIYSNNIESPDMTTDVMTIRDSDAYNDLKLYGIGEGAWR